MSAFQTRAVPSLLVVTTRSPSELKDAEVTYSLWPMRIDASPPPTCQTRAVPSVLAVATSVARGLKETSVICPT